MSGGHWEVSRRWVPAAPAPGRARPARPQLDAHAAYNVKLKSDLHAQSIARRQGAGHRPPTRQDLPPNPATMGDPAYSSAAEQGALCAAFYKANASVHRPAGTRPTFSESGVAAAWNSKLKTSSESPIIANPLAAVFRQLDDDGSGNVDTRELKWMMQKVELTPAQIDAQLRSFEANSKDISALEGGADQVSLAEWEKGLLPDTRSAIEARLDADGRRAHRTSDRNRVNGSA